MKNVLITGGLGLIGSCLAEKYVQNGDNVSIISKTRNKIRNIYGLENKLHLIIKDIKNISPKDVADKDYIFHFASTVDNYNIQTDPFLDVDVNCNGTISLLEACHKSNPKVRIVYPSTFFVNGNLKKLPANPNSPCNPLGLYPATKLAAENFCKIYNSVFEMNSVIARFTNVFGEKEENTNKKKAAFNYLIELALKNSEIPLYQGGEFYRDYIFVDDVANACDIIAEKGEAGEIYYVGLGKTKSFRELIDIVLEESNSKSKIKTITPPDFHKKVGIQDFYCDTALLKNLGWNPKVSLREGIKRTIEFYKNERK